MKPIRVVVAKGDEDVSIKIADQGGGVPRSTMKQIFKFAHSTADSKEAQTEFGKDELTGGRIRGFGLPLARIYARYFGGELTLKSMEGYGLDAYVYLPRLGDSCENLPISVISSPGDRDSTPFTSHHEQD
jgi:pyruvate dehydrogenase kinase 2/3/4